MPVDIDPYLNPLKDVADLIAARDAPVNLDGAHAVPPLLARDIKEVEQEAIRGPGLTPADLPAYINAVKNLNGGVGINDRLFMLEKLLTLMARAPNDSAFAASLQQVAIDVLYKDLPHPPSGYLSLTDSVAPTGPSVSKGVKYAFRSADGANYNVLTPTLGMAGMPYARSTPSTTTIPPSYLPDPGLVFDTLLKRDEFVEHPGGLSSLFFAFADLVIHSIFNTNTRDWTVNDSSSYLDLSPLYGSSIEQVNSVRRKDGTGRLYEDVFADSRLLFMPPSTGALLVLFCRNHNYVAERILAINELGAYSTPEKLDEKKRLAQDEEIFQRSRLVNSAFFMQVILGDYVGAILGLTRDGLSWRLDPLSTMREIGHEFSPQGQGNVVSVEFNLMYRWHATISQPDTQWLDALFSKLFDGKDGDEITVDDFKKAIIKYVMNSPTDVKEWTFDNLKRGPDGRYSDDDLAKILLDATEAPASAFKARGIPETMRVIEILGILQARSWGTCSLNEFRKFMGLEAYSTFQEWNPDPKIYKAAESLYHDIDNLELYVGLQAEEPKVPMPGAGLCPGYTISRAILADAVCLTRGDRFLTVDLTPFNLTTWGYQDVQYNKEDGSMGGILSRLLFRTLPKHYSPNSAYAYFPFMVPKTMKTYVAKLANHPVDKYSWERPSPALPSITLTTLQVPSGAVNAGAGYEKRLEAILGGVIPDRTSVQQVLFSDAAVKKWEQSFLRITQQLIQTKSIDHVDSKAKYINIVRNVINVLPIVWIANEIVGLPLKTDANPRGIYPEQELVQKFADVANYVFVNISAADDLLLREKTSKTAKMVTGYIKGHLAKLGAGSLSGLTDSVINWVSGANEHDNSFMKSLLAAGKHSSHDALAAGLFAEAVATAALYSRALAEIVDYSLEDDRQSRLVFILSDSSPDLDRKLLDFIREALPRLGSAGSQTGFDSSRVVATGLMRTNFFEKTACVVLRTIFTLKNFKRASGPSGHLNQFTDNVNGSVNYLYLSPKGGVTPFPVSMLAQYTV